jgi:transcription initiation factor TFIID subunit 6
MELTEATAHWLAVEGVQPSIPQNPQTSEARDRELMPKGPNVNPALAAMNSSDSTTVKPLVKHILSKELQLYFERVCVGSLNDESPELRSAALASLQNDNGISQLVTYFVQFIQEKITHNLKDLFVLTQMMYMTEALTRNETLNLAPYVRGSLMTISQSSSLTALQVQSIVPPVLTCLIGRNLGTGIGTLDHFDLRDLAASIVKHLCDKYSKYSHSLKPRIARSCLKSFLDPKKPFGSHYGAILGLRAVGGAEVVRKLVLPNLKAYEEIFKEDLQEGSIKKAEAEKVVAAIIGSLGMLVDEAVPMTNGHSNQAAEQMTTQLIDKVGEVIGEKIANSGNLRLARAILDETFDF